MKVMYLLQAKWASRNGYEGEQDQKIVEHFDLKNEKETQKVMEVFLKEIGFWTNSKPSRLELTTKDYEIMAISEKIHYCFVTVIPIIRFGDEYFEMKPLAI